MSNIQSVLESIYADEADVTITVSDDGRVNLVVNDPEGDSELTLGRAFDRKDSNCRSNPHYSNTDELIALINYEIMMAPQVRDNIRKFIADVG